MKRDVTANIMGHSGELNAFCLLYEGRREKKKIKEEKESQTK